MQTPVTTTSVMRGCLRAAVLLIFGLGSMLGSRVAGADTVPTLFNSFAGNINFIGTQKTLRTQSDGGDSCAINAGTTTAALAGLPAGATIRAAYLYWAGSGNTPGYSVTFEGSGIVATAARSYTATFVLGSTYNYFSGAYDVTGIVTTKGNGTYSFAGLTVNNGDPWCASSAVLGGWALLVIYSHSSEDFRVINVYEGFQAFRGSSITLTPSNFQIPVSPINGKDAHLTWEGDVGNSDPLNNFNERLTFEGNTLTDANNPPNNQFNSVSTINSPVDTVSYGVDFDVYDVSSYLVAGQTSATTVYSSGGDLVLLSAQIISTTNAPVADLAITKTRNGDLIPGQNASYTLNVINNGPLNETGPVTIVDTLPAGLSYVLASGTGWSCSAAAPFVTCNRLGSLASGASTPALTLTVAVSPSASGTVINTATVSGQDFDNISWNNTATDSYTIPLATYAYYKMDEANWTGAGAVTDSSGNGRNGTALGSAAPTGYPPASPPGSAIPGNPGTCGAGSVPVTAGTQGVNTAIDLNSMGNAGTISFWYSHSTTAWNDGTDRMLFDASNELGSNAQDKHFYLVKGDTGRLRFALENSADTDYEARDPTTRAFAAGTWHHIAVTWNVGADVARLYLDGVQVATSAATAGTLGDTATLYLGDQRNAVGGTPGDFTTNSANGYLDEVRLYASALTAAQIAADMNATHSCVALDHYELSLPTNSITCLPTIATVTACADSSSPCTNTYAAASGTTATLAASGGTLATTPVTFGPTGVASTTLSYPAAADGTAVTVTLSGEQIPATSPRKCCPNGVSCAVANFCSTTFNTAGIIFSNAADGVAWTIPTQTAGASSGTYYLRAVKTNTTTKACETALAGANQVNFAYECNNPLTCSASNLMSVNGGSATTIARNDNGSVSSYTPVNMTFDANGNAPFTFNYSDVGRVTLWANKTVNAAPLTGSSNPFVVKPGGFLLSNIIRTSDSFANPAAANATDPVFVKAGEGFTTTVTATTTTASGALTTPNYGKETTTPETVKLTRALVAPVGGIPGSDLIGTFGAFTNGVATGTTFTWNEVGIISLTPSVGDADYLGAGDTTGTTTGNIGRFIPDHFTLSAGALANRGGACTPASNFTYLDEGLNLQLTLTAERAGGGATLNYDGTLDGGGYAKLTPGTFSNYGIGARSDPTNLTSRITGSVLGAPAWASGVLNALTANVTVVARTVTLRDGPWTGTQFGVAPSDSDGTQLLASALNLDVDNNAANDHQAVGAPTELRFGRLRLHNAYGSELLPLPVPMTVQYWNGTAFVTNALDSCTPLIQANIGMVNNLSGGGTTSVTVTQAINNGAGQLSLSPPGAGKTGSVDLAINLGITGTAIAAACPTLTPLATAANQNYLQGRWCGAAYDKDPAARATFGVYANPSQFIYLREMY